jgi:beta-glucosidase
MAREKSTTKPAHEAIFRRNSIMLRKVIGLLMFLSVCSFALPVVSTGLDSVKVPLNILRGSGTTWSGKVYYKYTVGDNDSLNISLAIIPAAATPNAPACTITKTVGDVGMFPMVTGMNGRRQIFFDCSFATAPASTDQYVATITILADMSANEKLARSVLAAIPDNATKALILAGGDGNPPQHDAFCTGDITVPGFAPAVYGLSCCDGPHGVNGWGQSWGKATMFPCNGTSANAFDTALIYQTGKAIAQEAKGLWQGRYQLLGPMINLVRDPRGGRDYETFGEDPYLMGKLGSAWIKGLQSEHVIATPKHFLCNDQDYYRLTASSNVDTVTLRQTYAYPFEMCIREAGAWGLMAAYNKVNGVYSTESYFLLMSILKNEWGFRGLAISDWSTQMTVTGSENSGLDVEMPDNAQYSLLPGQVTSKKLSQDSLDEHVLRVLRAKAWAGCMTTYPTTPDGLSRQALHDSTSSYNHQALTDSSAHHSLVLLKNDSVGTAGAKKVLLPIDRTKTVAVIGPYADHLRYGGYGTYTSSKVSPWPYDTITALYGITAKLGASHITTSVATADYIIVVLGVAANDGVASAQYESHDRPDPTLSYDDYSTNDQNAYVAPIIAAHPNNTIVVLTGGAAVTNGAWYTAPAVIFLGCDGERQGKALADALVGDLNPCGKSTITFPNAASDLPTFTPPPPALAIAYEKPTEGRGYPYYIGAGKTPLIPFGFGLSYTNYTYSNLQVPPNAVIGDTIVVTVDITNTGSVDGVEIPQLYITQTSPAAARTVKQLRGFARLTIPAGQKVTASFTLKEWDFAHWTKANGWIVDPNSNFTIYVGKNSMDAASLTQSIFFAAAN